jgi:hypothetical protein
VCVCVCTHARVDVCVCVCVCVVDQITGTDAKQLKEAEQVRVGFRV